MVRDFSACAMRAKSEGSPLPFCSLLNLKIFSTILTILFGFSVLGILISFLNLINESLISFTIS